MQYNSAAVYHKTGHFMFYCDQRRAKWYLKKGLGEIVYQDQSRLEIKLNFETAGPGPNDEFSSHEILQRCVVCGSVENLTKHHVVPTCYRKFFPIEYKSRINHDVVIICENHHHIYEDFANILKDRLADKYDIPNLQQCSQMQSPTANPLLKKLSSTKSLCVAYLNDLNKRKEINQKVVEKLNSLNIDVNTDDVAQIIKDTDNQIETIKSVSSTIDHGEMLVSKLEDIDKFIRYWRKHFLSIMKPKFMPKGWSVNYRTNIKINK